MLTRLIERYLAHLRSQSSSENTIDDRRRTLTVLNRDLPGGLLSNADELDTWLWREGLSLGSRETYYGAMNGFFTWAHDEGIIDFNPMELITRPKVPKRLPNPVSDHELHRLVTEAAEPFRTFVILASFAGLRCMEIAQLDRADITDRIIVRCGKGRKPRIVPTHEEVWAAVAALPAGRITDHDAEWVSQRSWLHFARRLGMPKVGLHRCRHWFGTQVQRKHRDILVTQQLLGHENPATTAGYAQVAAVDMEAAVSLLPRLSDVAVAASRSGVAPAPR
jgi:integrase/recombinase XerC